MGVALLVMVLRLLPGKAGRAWASSMSERLGREPTFATRRGMKTMRRRDRASQGRIVKTLDEAEERKAGSDVEWSLSASWIWFRSIACRGAGWRWFHVRVSFLPCQNVQDQPFKREYPHLCLWRRRRTRPREHLAPAQSPLAFLVSLSRRQATPLPTNRLHPC